MKAAYRSTEQQVEKLERTVRSSSRGFQLGTELEKIAQNYGVTIDSIKQSRGMPNDFYRESFVNVSVKKVNLRTSILYRNLPHPTNNFQYAMSKTFI